MLQKDAFEPEEFDLFLSFLKGDPRIQDALLWVFSIDTKAKAMDIFYKEILELMPKCLEEVNKLEEEGHFIEVECTKLVIKYEAFLNSIYALCENLSRIVRYLYRTKNLPESFSDQRTRFLRDRDIDPLYSKILGSIDWYDEVSAIRHQAVHYLSGMVVFPTFTELGYSTVPKSNRKDVLKEISINNIEEHVKKIRNAVLSFLRSVGEHFITIIDQDVRVSTPCTLPTAPLEPIGHKLISFREHKNGEPGICQTPGWKCPIKHSCVAYKKSKSGKIK